MPKLQFECPKCLVVQDASMSCKNCGHSDPIGIEILLRIQKNRGKGRTKESVVSAIIPIITIGGFVALIVMAIITGIVALLLPESSITNDDVQLNLIIFGSLIGIAAMFFFVKSRCERRENAMDDLYEFLAKDAREWVANQPEHPNLQGVSMRSFTSPLLQEEEFSQYLVPDRTLGKHSSGGDGCSSFSKNFFASKLRNTIKNHDGSCDISFKDAVASIAALKPELEPETIQHAAYTSCVLTENEREQITQSFTDALEASQKKWRTSLMGEYYLKRVQNPLGLSR